MQNINQLKNLIQQIPILEENNYILSQQIGKGSLSSVYLALNLEKKLVTIKKILKSEWQAIAKEIQFTAFLTPHPNFLNHIDICCYNYEIYLVTEHNNYSDLSKVEQNGSFQEKKDLCLKIAKAINWMHQKEVVHLDIKPENILINKNEIKIIDFNLSCYLGDSKEINPYLKKKGYYGTPLWIAPEFLKDVIDDLWDQPYPYNVFDNLYLADIYSLGLVFYYIFHNNKLPYTAKTKKEMVVKKLERTQDLEKFKLDTGNQELNDLIWNMISPLPIDRPSLEKIIDHLST